MSYAMPPQPAQKSGKPWTLIIGGVITLLAILLCCGGGIPMASYASDLMDAPEHQGAHTLQLDEGESAAVWTEAGAGTTCSVSGPSGSVSNEGSAEQTLTVNGKELERTFAFDAPADGSYTVTCSGTFVVGDSMPMAAVAVMVGGGALGCLAVVLVIVGLVLWLSKRKG
ncbi:MAG TPA: hypothetical protein H9805_11145 [Candidatus Janibacter merdipullorum]|nr:hypothetical protein [Candidatus Janibacter merdipullorum]